MMKVQSSTVPSITIESNSNTAIRDAEHALAKIASQPNGNALLSGLNNFSQSGKRVKIFVAPRGGNMRNATMPVDDIDSPGEDNRNAMKNASKSSLGFKGKGASAIVEWNPSKSLALNAAGEPVGHTQDTSKAYLSLAHELVHAYRITKGTYTGGSGTEGFQPGTRAAEEELRATGLDKWADEPISENGIRAEHGEPPRRAYPLSRDRGDQVAEFDPTATYRG
ncbi:hypothetical protein DBA20_24055 [Pandoraea capi]|nr:hypothetical protein [Pandoraea sp. LA3]MDN4586057.1 hypothetical protein [Pandoraea capi]